MTDRQQQQIESYLDLLIKWNKAYNLTAIREREEMRIKHVNDALAVVPFLSDAPLLDLGSGAGVPGVLIAIAKPDLPVTLLDSVGKKTRFLQQVVMALQLDHVTVVHSRIENFVPERLFGQVISRGVDKLDQLWALSEPVLAKDGVGWAMKAQGVNQELSRLPSYVDHQSFSVQVDGLDATRCLVAMKRNTGDEI